MKNIIKKIALLSIAVFVFFSCKTKKFDEATFTKAYEARDWATCISMLEGKKYEKDAAPLKNMDIAILHHYQKNFAESKARFKECERLMNDGDLRSIMQFESFYLHILNALNYNNEGNDEGALIEIKQVDEVKVNKGRNATNALWYVNFSTDDEVALQSIRGFDEDEKESEEYGNTMTKFGISPAEVSKGTPRKPTENDLYRGSPTAYYLGAILRDIHGDENGARLDKDLLKMLNPKVEVPTKKDGVENLNIIAFAGQIAQKEEVVYYYPPEENGEPRYMDAIKVQDEKGNDLSLEGMRYKFAYARATENETSINNIVAIATNTETGEKFEKTFSFLEDFGEDLKKNVGLTARKEYNKNKAKSIIGKSLLAMTLQLSIIVAQASVNKIENPLLALGAQAALEAAKVGYTAGLEKFDRDNIKADTRTARFLPAHSYVTSLEVPSGTYNISVQYKKGNTLIYEDKFDSYEVKSSSPNLLESICLD